MTTFTYTDDIPNSPNNPSNDQPIMKVNTNSVSGLIAVDHVGFNASGGGQHEQVTFNSNNVPSVPTSPPVLFTNNDAFGTPQLFFYSGNSSKTSDQYKLGTNGSTYAMGGIIIKWGVITVTAGINTITYSALSPAISSFPNATFSVVLSQYAGAVTANNVITSFNNSSFTFTTNSSGQRTFMAIGN